MNFTDFEYNGRRLSEFGCIICCINSGGGLETKDIGNKITFNKLNFKGKNNAQRFKLTDTTYEEAFGNQEMLKLDQMKRQLLMDKVLIFLMKMLKLRSIIAIM